MRTTVRIDDDVLAVARDRARREQRSIGDVLSELARTALSPPPRSGAEGARPRHGFLPLASRGGLVTNRIVDEIRDEEGV